MKDDIDLALEALEKAKILMLAKNQDYNSSGVSISDYWLYGEKSLIHELWKKVLRLKSLITRDKTMFESKQDSLIDLINYAAYYYAYLEKRKP